MLFYSLIVYIILLMKNSVWQMKYSQNHIVHSRLGNQYLNDLHYDSCWDSEGVFKRKFN